MSATLEEWGHLAAEDDDWYYIVRPMLFNYRVVKVPKDDPMSCASGFCYIGRDQQTLLRALVAAMVWAVTGEDQPRDWDKNVETGEMRSDPVDGKPVDAERGTGVGQVEPHLPPSPPDAAEGD